MKLYLHMRQYSASLFSTITILRNNAQVLRGQLVLSYGLVKQDGAVLVSRMEFYCSNRFLGLKLKVRRVAFDIKFGYNSILLVFFFLFYSSNEKKFYEQICFIKLKIK